MNDEHPAAAVKSSKVPAPDHVLLADVVTQAPDLRQVVRALNRASVAAGNPREHDSAGTNVAWRILTVGQLRRLTVADIEQIEGVGPKTLTLLREVLTKLGHDPTDCGLGPEVTRSALVRRREMRQRTAQEGLADGTLLPEVGRIPAGVVKAHDGPWPADAKFGDIIADVPEQSKVVRALRVTSEALDLKYPSRREQARLRPREVPTNTWDHITVGTLLKLQPEEFKGARLFGAETLPTLRDLISAVGYDPAKSGLGAEPQASVSLSRDAQNLARHMAAAVNGTARLLENHSLDSETAAKLSAALDAMQQATSALSAQVEVTNFEVESGPSL